jgi:hypothetical protein
MPLSRNNELTDYVKSLDWQTIPESFSTNRFDVSKGSMPLLFRGHAFLDPHSVRADYEGVIHATPIFRTATSQLQFSGAKNYQGFPNNVSFLTVYSCHPEQRFFYDQEDDLKHAYQAGKGASLGSIERFDPAAHHETAIERSKGNQVLGTFMVQYEAALPNKIVPVPDDPKFHALMQASFKAKATSIAFEKNHTAPAKDFVAIDSIVPAKQTKAVPDR